MPSRKGRWVRVNPLTKKEKAGLAHDKALRLIETEPPIQPIS